MGSFSPEDFLIYFKMPDGESEVVSYNNDRKFVSSRCDVVGEWDAGAAKTVSVKIDEDSMMSLYLELEKYFKGKK